MDQGYVKLWRSVADNELLSRDNTCLIIYIHVLLHADWRTGEYKTGRNKLATLCNLKPSTAYKAIKRLETFRLLSTRSNSKVTTFYICNWTKEQQLGNSSVTERSDESNTKQEVRKRNNIDNKLSIYKADKPAKTPSRDIDEMFEYWTSTVGYEASGQRQANRYACSNLLKKYGKDKLKQLISGVAKAQEDKYAPRISDFKGLQAKQNDLIAWGKQKATNNNGGVTMI